MRPYVVVNAAMSVDGKLALADGRGVQISNQDDLRRVHALRAASDAILVGIGTVLKDDPKLTVKPEYARGKSPLRVVLDSDGQTPRNSNVLDGSAPTLIVTANDCSREFPHAEVLRCGMDDVDLPGLLDHLGGRGVARLLVEGGSTVIWSFLRQRLADEMKVFIANIVLGGQLAPTLAGGEGVTSVEDAVRLELQKMGPLGDGVLLEYSVVR